MGIIKKNQRGVAESLESINPDHDRANLHVLEVEVTNKFSPSSGSLPLTAAAFENFRNGPSTKPSNKSMRCRLGMNW
jgi:hypothetical protein